MENKHAYLLIAHNQFELLKTLMSAIDYPYNDIYVHIDLKENDVNFDDIRSVIKFSDVYFLENRLDIKWGEFSQIECELRLLEAATQKKYLYYHLMSGADMPLKSQKYIHDFFTENYDTEFIHFDAPTIDKETYQRVSKYVFFNRKNKNLFEKIIYKILMFWEFGIDRGKKTDWIYQKGANWFSITDKLARYVISNRKIIEKQFRYTRCADEVFLQTLVYNSSFKEKISVPNYCDNYACICYCIDWRRGEPYTYRMEDYDFLKNSGMLFARKFNWDIDKKIVKKICSEVRMK